MNESNKGDLDFFKKILRDCKGDEKGTSIAWYIGTGVREEDKVEMLYNLLLHVGDTTKKAPIFFNALAYIYYENITGLLIDIPTSLGSTPVGYLLGEALEKLYILEKENILEYKCSIDKRFLEIDSNQSRYIKEVLRYLPVGEFRSSILNSISTLTGLDALIAINSTGPSFLTGEEISNIIKKDLPVKERCNLILQALKSDPSKLVDVNVDLPEVISHLPGSFSEFLEGGSEHCPWTRSTQYAYFDSLIVFKSTSILTKGKIDRLPSSIENVIFKHKDLRAFYLMYLETF